MMKVVRVRGYLAVMLGIVCLSLIFLLYKSMKNLALLDGSLPGVDAPVLLAPLPARHHANVGGKDEVQFYFKRGPGLVQERVVNRSLKTPHAQSYSRGKAIHETTLPTHYTKLLESSTASRSVSTVSNPHWPPPNYCMHVFYYMWYANVTVDGEYKHWNHPYMPHWDASVDKRYPHGRHQPPDDIGACFYPKLGCYSSRDQSTIEIHMQQMRRAGIGVVAVSWYPPSQRDDHGRSPDHYIPLLLDIAHKYSMKVTIHSEPYQERSPSNFRRDLEYIHDHYTNHPALLKIRSPRDKSLLPLVYVYDSYLYQAGQWAQVLSADGAHTIRGTHIDCIAIALLVNNDHKRFVLDGGFDGFYTYFASDGFSHGSRTRSWPSLAVFGKQHNVLFIPSAGPGYDDTRVRAWNKVNTKLRRNGDYYKHMMSSAVESNSGIVSITSFNEWHEGTQIEPAIPKQAGTYHYLDYLPNGPEYYLDLTKSFSARHKCSIV